MRFRWGGWLFVASSAACSRPVLPTPTPEVAASHGTDVAMLTEGRDLYIARCTRCHLAVMPSAFNEAEWVFHVDDMRDRSALTDAERDAIVAYVTAFAAGQAAPPSSAVPNALQPGTLSADVSAMTSRGGLAGPPETR